VVFSSILFLFCFLPLFLIGYHIVGKPYRNAVLLIFSLVFYTWCAQQFIFILLLSLCVNFWVVKKIVDWPKFKKLFLLISLLVNIGMLVYFKYTNFFVENLNYIFRSLDFNQIHWNKLLLPVGISFFTFQSITYTIDVYRKVHQPLEKLSDYILYILMFPQLIAGPIVRFNTVADDIIDRERTITSSNRVSGIFIFIVGLSKKVLIANVLGKFVDHTFSFPVADSSTEILWITIIAYSFQIYFDFSGYSDMAIGLGKIIGFKFPENFNNPYISQSISEFWRRWHITLGDWMKDYLYIPLGGNRSSSKIKLYFNLIVVFLISGFWHGAEWTFIIWGAWHGLFLILDRLFLKNILKKIGLFNRVLLNYLVVLIGWVFFRSNGLHDASVYLKRMFVYSSGTTSCPVDNEFIAFLILAVLISFFGIFPIGQKIQKWIYSEPKTLKTNTIMFVLSSLFLMICAAFITASDFNPFIYFRF
jgi:alginate O-acetyltransferase complex protein AlgI